MSGPGGIDRETLEWACVHPFATVSILAGLLGRAYHDIFRVLHRLQAAGLVTRIRYESPSRAHGHSYYALVEGFHALARMRNEEPQQVVGNLGASYQQMRWIAERLDQVMPLYTLAATISRADGTAHASRKEERLDLTGDHSFALLEQCLQCRCDAAWKAHCRDHQAGSPPIEE